MSGRLLPGSCCSRSLILPHLAVLEARRSMALPSAPLATFLPSEAECGPQQTQGLPELDSKAAGLKNSYFSFSYVLLPPATSHTRSNPLYLLLPVQKLQLPINYSARSIPPCYIKNSCGRVGSSSIKSFLQGSCHFAVLLWEPVMWEKRCLYSKGMQTWSLRIKGQKLSYARAYCLTK